MLRTTALTGTLLAFALAAPGAGAAEHGEGSGTAPFDISTIQLRASEVIGADVVNAAGEEIGEVSDLLMTAKGQTRAAVISVGGFLGVGDKLVAVRLQDLSIRDDEPALLDTTSEQLSERPAFNYENMTPDQFAPVGTASQQQASSGDMEEQQTSGGDMEEQQASGEEMDGQQQASTGSMDGQQQAASSAGGGGHEDYMARWSDRMENWKEKVETQSAETAETVQSETMQAWEKAEKEWNELKQSSAETWDDASQSFEEAYESFRTSWNEQQDGQGGTEDTGSTTTQ